jgi:hypothetical protein
MLRVIGRGSSALLPEGKDTDRCETNRSCSCANALAPSIKPESKRRVSLMG